MDEATPAKGASSSAGAAAAAAAESEVEALESALPASLGQYTAAVYCFLPHTVV